MGGEIVIYQNQIGNIKIDVRLEEETVWLTQDQMAILFGKAKSTINEHIKNIFGEGELNEDSVVRKFRTTAADGKSYDTNYYNLDVIISVGYRVKSPQGTQFRIWATQRLKEYLIKGFALNDDRFKSGNSMNYLDELQERIRQIRLSERFFYQKIKDIYTTSIDYDPKDEKTVTFFKVVQNKLLWAISQQTAAELVYRRANAALPLMGMQSYDRKETEVIKRRIQVINATFPSLAIACACTSFGVWNPYLFLGRLFNISSTSATRSSVISAKSMSLGKYWRTRPLRFSFAPRSQEW
jgi:hypothetical protein